MFDGKGCVAGEIVALAAETQGIGRGGICTHQIAALTSTDTTNAHTSTSTNTNKNLVEKQKSSEIVERVRAGGENTKTDRGSWGQQKYARGCLHGQFGLLGQQQRVDLEQARVERGEQVGRDERLQRVDGGSGGSGVQSGRLAALDLAAQTLVAQLHLEDAVDLGVAGDKKRDGGPGSSRQ